MKKVVLLLAVVVSSVFVACEGNEKTESVGVGLHGAMDALEVLSDTTTVKDTTK